LRGHTKDVCTLQFDEAKIMSGSKDGGIKVRPKLTARVSLVLLCVSHMTDTVACLAIRYGT
jgi:hypothetical protein